METSYLDDCFHRSAKKRRNCRIKFPKGMKKFPSQCSALDSFFLKVVQGDHSGCDKPPIDFKNFKFSFSTWASYYNGTCYEVNGRFESRLCVTL